MDIEEKTISEEIEYPKVLSALLLYETLPKYILLLSLILSLIHELHGLSLLMMITIIFILISWRRALNLSKGRTFWGQMERSQ